MTVSVRVQRADNTKTTVLISTQVRVDEDVDISERWVTRQGPIELPKDGSDIVVAVHDGERLLIKEE